MNVTLSADKDLIEKSRRYAKAQHTSLNDLIRGYLKAVTGDQSVSESVEEFRKLAKERGGKSPQGFRFNREEVHSRKGEA